MREAMVHRACTEVFAGRGWAAMHGWMATITVMKVGRAVGRKVLPAAVANGDEVWRRVIVSPAAFVKLVRCLVFR